MKEQSTSVNVQLRKLEPSTGKYLKNIKTLDVFQGPIFLGIYDSADNYIEVSESEYQQYLQSEDEKLNNLD